MSECLALMRTGLRKGQICGRAVRGYIRAGVGRCDYHLTVHERTRVRAVEDAVRDMYALRDVGAEEDAGGDKQDATEREAAFVDADGTVWHWESSAE